MRRRLTIAILAVVTGTLVLTTAGSLFLIRRASISTAGTETTHEVTAVAQLLSGGDLAAEVGVGAKIRADRILAVLREVGSYDFLRPWPSPPAASSRRSPHLSVPPCSTWRRCATARSCREAWATCVFAAVPVTLSARQQRNLDVPAGDDAVLLASRTVSNPVNGLLYFLLVAGGALLVAAVVASGLARRYQRTSGPGRHHHRTPGRR